MLAHIFQWGGFVFGLLFAALGFYVRMDFKSRLLSEYRIYKAFSDNVNNNVQAIYSKLQSAYSQLQTQPPAQVSNTVISEISSAIGRLECLQNTVSFIDTNLGEKLTIERSNVIMRLFKK